ncbi:MAG: DUF1963 domain-containing protein [Deltaproteobacteria bacterium]|nr:DUF1963 domain-containing protein [Deltaproteobacteria bacterium]
MRKCETATRSYLGGAPPLCHRLLWPTNNGRPLSLLACIDCTELPQSTELDWLPKTGQLLFFYDLQEQPWGYAPQHRGGSAVIYLAPADAGDTTSVMMILISCGETWECSIFGFVVRTHANSSSITHG